MSNAFRSQTSEVMCLAWQMVKRNGYSMSEALKTAWMNIKLKAAMKERIVSSTSKRWTVHYVRHTEH